MLGLNQISNIRIPISNVITIVTLVLYVQCKSLNISFHFPVYISLVLLHNQFQKKFQPAYNPKI